MLVGGRKKAKEKTKIIDIEAWQKKLKKTVKRVLFFCKI